MTPPPYETEARWDSHNWVSVDHKSTIVASSSSFEVPETHRSESRIVKAAIEAVSNSRVAQKQKVVAVKQLADMAVDLLDYQAKFLASRAQLEAMQAKLETETTLRMNAQDKVDSLTLHVNKLEKKNERMEKKQREVQKTLKERLRKIRKDKQLEEQVEATYTESTAPSR